MTSTMFTPALERVAGLLAELGVEVEVDAPLGASTTFRVGGNAALSVAPTSIDQVAGVVAVARRNGVPVLVIGRGSNMLVADDGFAGLALSLARCCDQATVDAAAATVLAGAMTALPVLARQTVAAGLTGFEWAVGVPGSIGGAVRMNAGGHGSDIEASLIRAQILDASTGEVSWWPREAIGLRFRGSALTDDHVVLCAELQLAHGDIESGKAMLAEIVRWRRDNQPGGNNCGSVFVNPVPGVVTAGALIDEAGLRGLRIGTAAVSDKHANFIQADDGGRASDVVAVIRYVRRVVAERSGYVMRSEARLVGFDDEVES